MRIPPFTFFCLLATLFGCAPELPDEVAMAYAILPETLDYNFDVKPILSDKCFACHGPDPETRMAGLRLDVGKNDSSLSPDEHRTRVRALKGELVRRMLTDDPEEVMPPPEANLTLSPHEIAVLTKWAKSGGPHAEHWAFTPPGEVAAPPLPDWGHNEIDAFVHQRLEREGLAISREAARSVLLQRATLAATGLPPDPALPAVYEQYGYEVLVDSLLARPAYGERMAAYWMDVARYADSDGYLDDKHRRVWPWRDWVIRAFNNDLPYDQFITQQLAGDLMPGADKQTTLATTFNRLHKRNSEAGIVFEEARVEYVADRTLTLGRAFLGLSIECAQCHDHKYDPVSQRDYYATFAMFNSTAELGTAIYGPDQTPGPALLLSDERQDSIIAYIEQLIAAEEGKLGQPAVTVPDIVTAKDGIHLDFDRFAADGIKHYSTPLRGGGGTSIRIREPGIGSGLNGRALYLTEFTHLRFPDKVGWFDRHQPFTVSLALKPDSLYAEAGILYHNEELRLGLKGYSLHLDSNRVRVVMAHSWPNNAIEVRTRDPLPRGEWSRLTMTYDGSSRAEGLRIFVDGERVATTTVYDSLYKGILYEYDIHTYGFRGLEIGTKAKSKLALGLGIDEVAIFPRDLSTTQQAPATLTALRGRLNDSLNAIPEIMVMGDLPEPRPTYILDRGMYDAPTTEVAPGVPEVVLPWRKEWPRNRYGLTRWVTDPANPLTARVWVNRVWAMHFGRGLVETTEDFGNQGALPSHPELLDWLAAWFVRSGWDTKALHRLILTSATFRQHSGASDRLNELDPENVLLARGPRFRLPAEMIRDKALASGGLLNRSVGGPSVYPYQPGGLWDELSDKSWRYVYPGLDDAGRYRRSLYTFRKRTATHPVSLIFDAPDNSVCTVRRPRSNTPLQALVLLNDPEYLEAATALAERLHAGGGTPSDKLRKAYQMLTARAPDEEELALLVDYYDSGVDLPVVLHSIMNTTDFYTLR
jgi:mono/diheme cytochrome c family protein